MIFYINLLAYNNHRNTCCLNVRLDKESFQIKIHKSTYTYYNKK